MANQLEIWVKEIHTDVRELRGEMGDLRKEVNANKEVEADVVLLKADVQALKDDVERRSQRGVAFAAPFFAALIGGLIAVAPHIP